MQLDILVRNVSSEVVLGAPRLPGLERLLAVAENTIFDGGADAWACRVFGVAQQQDLPIAPFAARAEGMEAESGYWLCATPVNLQAVRDSVVLAASELSLTTDEAREILASLTRYFADDEFLFFAPQPDRWYLRLDTPPAIATTLLEQAYGRDMSHFLPQGDDAKAWRGRMNEMQMLLHAHPVNEAREQAGKPVANGLWLWGGGVSSDSASPYATVLGDDALISGLAGGSGRALPTSLAECRFDGEGAHLVVLDVAQQSWDLLERYWFAGLAQSLKAGRVGGVRLHLAGADKTQVLRVTRRDLWKVWRRSEPLSDYLKSHLS